MKEKLNFSIVISAPRERVWTLMQDPEGYRFWTSAFIEGSYFTGSWNEGARIRFLSPSGGGMVSEIAESRYAERVSIRHLGEIVGGVEDTTSEKVLAWAPGYEDYDFAAVGGGTRLSVTVDAVAGFEDYMTKTFPQALDLLKQLCEREG